MTPKPLLASITYEIEECFANTLHNAKPITCKMIITTTVNFTTRLTLLMMRWRRSPSVCSGPLSVTPL
jgi:formate-dependent phosphoribosylglycinamide formyltransferase (GAR transformylase)